MEALIQQYGYLAVLIGTFLEGETILVLAGFAAHRGWLSLPGVMAAAFVGSLASDQIFFYIGRRHGSAWLQRHPRLIPQVDRVRPLLTRYETLLILSFRFLYGLRNVTPVALGLTSVSAARFAVLNVIGAALWAIVIALLGWFVGSAAEQMLGNLKHYELRILIAITTVGLLLWAWRTIRQRSRAHSRREEEISHGGTESQS